MRAYESLNVLLQRCGCKFTECGLELPSSLSLADWEAVGRALGELTDKLRWALGDWWAYGQHRYGDRSALVASDDWDGPSFQTCVNYGNVCQKFGSNRRRLLLTFTHHAEVAHLRPDEADLLLDWCEETREATGKPRVTRELRDEAHRRWIKQMSPRSHGVTETKTVALAVVPAPAPDTSEFVLIPSAAAPRHEPEVQQQLGETVPPEGGTNREAKEMALAGIYAALRMEAITADLRERLQQCLRILAPS